MLQNNFWFFKYIDHMWSPVFLLCALWKCLATIQKMLALLFITHFSKPVFVSLWQKTKQKEQKKSWIYNIHKNIFNCLFSVHKIISLSCHKQVCIMRLFLKKYSHHRETYIIMFCIFKENMDLGANYKTCGPRGEEVAQS